MAIIDRQYEKVVRQILNFGYDHNLQWQSLGSNYKMSDVAAAWIEAYLTTYSLTHIIQKHQEVYDQISKQIKQFQGVSLFPHAGAETPFANCIPVIFRDPHSMEQVNAMSVRHAVVLRKYYKPLRPTARSQALYDRIVCFPCHSDLTSEHLLRMIQIIKRLSSSPKT